MTAPGVLQGQPATPHRDEGLAASLLRARERAFRWLSRARNATGSWGHRYGRDGRGEPTCLAMAAGLEEPWAWLEEESFPAGALRLLPWVVPRSQADRAAVGAVLDALEAESAITVPGVTAFDASIPAWGWTPGTAPWTIPTAQAVGSLRRGNRGGGQRARQGVRYLLDRQCADGGWNFGNPRMLGAELESTPEPTAWALLALSGLSGAREAGLRGLRRLETWSEAPSSTTLALGVLARAAWGRTGGPSLRALLARQDRGGAFFHRVDATALACCAMAVGLGHPHPLEL